MVRAFLFADSMTRRVKILNFLLTEKNVQVVGIADEYELAVTSIFKLKPDLLIHYGEDGKEAVFDHLRKIRVMNPVIKIVILGDEPDCCANEVYKDNIINFCAQAGELNQINRFISDSIERVAH